MRTTRCFRERTACSNCTISAGVRMSGKCSGTRGHGIRATTSGRRSVVAYKNFSAATYIRTVAGWAFRSRTRCSRNARTSASPSAAGDFP